MEVKKEIITVTLETEVLAELEKLAAENDRSLSEEINEILKQDVEKGGFSLNEK